MINSKCTLFLAFSCSAPETLVVLMQAFFSKLHLPIKKLHTRKSNGGFLALKRSLSHWQKGTYIPVEMTLTKKRADYSVFKEMDQQSSSTT